MIFFLMQIDNLTGMEIVEWRERNGICRSSVDGKEPCNRNCDVHAYWAVMCAGRSSRQAHNVICGFSIGKRTSSSSSTKKNLHFLYGFIYLLKSFFFFFRKVNFRKVNYFLIFDSVMKNKLENTFQCLVMSWKISWKITY